MSLLQRQNRKSYQLVVSLYFMVNPFELTPTEKEEYVLDMLEREYSWRQIMKECHVSPNTISSIKKKHGGTIDDYSSTQSNKVSAETQCFRCFQQGKSILATKLETDIPSSDVLDYHKKYQELLNRDSFNIAYNRVSGNIGPFLDISDLMYKLGMTPEQVAEQVRHGINLPYLGSMHLALSRDVWALQSQKYAFESQLTAIRNQFEEYKASLEFYDNECRRKRNELTYLDSEIHNKKNVIQSFDNDEGYTRLKEAAKNETKLVIQNNQVSCALMLTATLEAIRRYPENQMLIYEIITPRNYSTTSYSQTWMESHAPPLLQLMQNVQNEMVEHIASITVNNTEIGMMNQ